MPSYPNWQRKRIQNPCSVSSSLTEGTKIGAIPPTGVNGCAALLRTTYVARSRHPSF